ncbi:unnamed protein product [Lactuca virosa]|uniref:Protein kinase domain-containing protein n=1 Tax=Lactuca virosa TaxID=75947 RepID=A0AAU9P950_9ASTR|nr:unnamed protein product [Lactuca virosa]
MGYPRFFFIPFPPYNCIFRNCPLSASQIGSRFPSQTPTNFQRNHYRIVFCESLRDRPPKLQDNFKYISSQLQDSLQLQEFREDSSAQRKRKRRNSWDPLMNSLKDSADIIGSKIDNATNGSPKIFCAFIFLTKPPEPVIFGKPEAEGIKMVEDSLNLSLKGDFKQENKIGQGRFGSVYKGFTFRLEWDLTSRQMFRLILRINEDESQVITVSKSSNIVLMENLSKREVLQINSTEFSNSLDSVIQLMLKHMLLLVAMILYLL